jgi:hypothetical protein
VALKVVCSYCKKDMGEKPSEHTGISHGGCPHCLRLVTIEDVLADKIEAEAVELFGQTTKLAEAKYVLRDGTLIGSKERVHSEICSIDEVLEHILLDREPSLRMTLEEARAKYPGKSLMDILDMEIGEAFIDACPDTFKFITGAGRIVPDAGGYYFAFQKMPTMMQAAVMEKALKEKPSLGVEIS